MASNVTATILVPIDTTAGASAIDYTPRQSECPILAIHCISSSGSGDVKITPLRSSLVTFLGDGEGARIRLACDAMGRIITAEIAAGGTGYPDGPVQTVISDPFGSGGELLCIASGGEITQVSIVSPGIGYSGYITMKVDDFIEGVTYDFIPRYVEKIGSGDLRLLGYKLAFRPFQVF